MNNSSLLRSVPHGKFWLLCAFGAVAPALHFIFGL
jgi:hypothetical protein